MTQVKLSCGFEGEVNEDAVNDIEFLEAIALMSEQDNPLGLVKLCNLMMSKEDKKRLYDACRDENGRATTEKVGKQITELLEQLQSKKK